MVTPRRRRGVVQSLRAITRAEATGPGQCKPRASCTTQGRSCVEGTQNLRYVLLLPVVGVRGVCVVVRQALWPFTFVHHAKLSPCIASHDPVKSRHPERHRTEPIGWLRAAMLGANDGIVSTASPVLGLSPTARLVRLVAVASLLCLGALGAIAARTGGARAW